MRYLRPQLSFLLILPALLSGCHHRTAIVAAPPAPKKPLQLAEADLERIKANEAGAIMIVMYHDFDPSKPDGDLNRKPESFRRDLQVMYEQGYRPVTVTEMLQNRMDLPAGKTPIVLTFDDSKPTQFKVITGADGKTHIDPNCAVGIMETFHKKNADWRTSGTFFVLPKEGRNPDPFSQPESVGEKFAYLLKNGYEIGNHTSTHSNMRGMSGEKVQWELATAKRDIKQIAPEATLEVFAIPYGAVPNKGARPFLVKGSSGGTSYEHKAVLLAAWRPVLSPITRNDPKLSQGGTFCVFNRWRLERVKPNPKQANQPGTLEYYLQYFKQNPGQRYISDGNPDIVAVPVSAKSWVDEKRLLTQHKTLQVYGGGSAKGGELHVQ